MKRAALAALAAATVLVVASGTGAVAGAMITGKQIKNSSVTGKDIRDGSLLTGDLAPDARAALRGPAGPPGTPGSQGVPGAPGTPGDPASISDGYVVVTSSGEANAVDGSGAGTVVYCPVGHLAVGGGGRWTPALGTAGDSSLSTNQPVRANRDGAGQPTGPQYDFAGNPDGWAVGGINHSGTTAHIDAWVLCVPAQP
jgi:hypothetical protein